MKNNDRDVRFIRKNGRVIPIRIDVNVNDRRYQNQSRAPRDRSNDYLTAGAAGLGVTGAAVAADAARTRRVYQRNGVTIDRKKMAIQPFVFDRLGDTLVMRDKSGKKMARASWYKNFSDNEKKGSFSWLGVKKQHRGKGAAKTLSRVAAHEMKKQGVDAIWNQVVHPGSMRANLTKNDSFWKAKRMLKNGDSVLEKVNTTEAERSINWFRKTKGIMTSNIFRHTKLKNQKTVFPGIVKPYLTRQSKIKIAAGAAAALLGIGGAIYNEVRK